MKRENYILLDQLLVNDIGNQLNLGPEKDLFGVEVELEGMKVVTTKPNIMEYWAHHQDGSLRVTKLGAEAIEYVFKKPLTLTQTTKAVTALFDYLNNTAGVEVFDSYRTSIHVHVNCLNETIRTIVNFITLCVIFDELLVSQNGDTRIGNNFCLRARDAEGQVRALIDSITNQRTIYNLGGNDRYSSINFISLMKFGSIEFRSLECTTDRTRLLHWIGTIQSLKEMARKYQNPREIISTYSQLGPDEFISHNLKFFGDKYKTVYGCQGMLSKGMRLAQDFAFCSDWVVPPAGAVSKSPPKAGAKQKAMFAIPEEAYWPPVPPPPPPHVPQPAPLVPGPIPAWLQQLAAQPDPWQH